MTRLRPAMIRIALIALSALAADSSEAANVVLNGTVGPGFTIILKKGSAKVASLVHGTYTIKISDQATSHNFHLSGPGVNKLTGVTFKGAATWTVTFKKGTYTYVCDPHAGSMKGSFKVT